MNWDKIQRAGFASFVCLVSLPWLTPCAPGNSGDSSLSVSPDRDLLYQEVKPGAALIVRQNQPISRQLLISGEEANQLTSINSKSWRRIELSSSPLMVLEGDDVRVARQRKRDMPSLALASTSTTMAKATIVTPQGTIFAAAQRIHYRGPSSELVLEGNPIMRFGPQEVKSARPDALMKLNFVTRTVSVSSRAIETKL